MQHMVCCISCAPSEVYVQKLKNSIEKEERIFMRQHGFAAKKYEKSAAETREAMLIKAHVQR